MQPEVSAQSLEQLAYILQSIISVLGSVMWWLCICIIFLGLCGSVLTAYQTKSCSSKDVEDANLKFSKKFKLEEYHLEDAKSDRSTTSCVVYPTVVDVAKNQPQLCPHAENCQSRQFEREQSGCSIQTSVVWFFFGFVCLHHFHIQMRFIWLDLKN